jgi:hypothetical protein
MKIKSTGGKWDKNRWPCYFAASGLGWPTKVYKPLDQMLIAVNEIDGKLIERFEVLLEQMPIFLDSGVFNLTNRHAERHGISMDEALTTDPEKIDGFQELFDKYVELVQTYGAKLWGYIELDQGGRENKIKTRGRLEKLGIVPIPVYHPFNDGWDYFDYLAERYDRICFGNVVMADNDQRKRLIATAWERRRKYPHLWIHALGLTPTELTVAFPINSCDSSTWAGPVRWGQHRSFAATSSFGALGYDFVYEYGVKEGPNGYSKAVTLCSYDAFMINRQMRVIRQDQEASLGCDVGMFNA